jgi:hypothetical protein
VWLVALVALVVTAVRAGGVCSWWLSASVGLLLVAAYGMPIALFIRRPRAAAWRRLAPLIAVSDMLTRP